MEKKEEKQVDTSRITWAQVNTGETSHWVSGGFLQEKLV